MESGCAWTARTTSCTSNRRTFRWRLRCPARSPDLARGLPLALLLLGATAAPAQEAGSPAGDVASSAGVVSAVRVQGNTHTDSARIVRSFDVPVGSAYSREAVQRGMRKLFALGLFDDIWVEELRNPPQVVLVLHVTERPRIGSVEFAGNEKVQAEELRRKLYLRVGDTYSPIAVQGQVDSLLRFYRREGYSRASIEAAADSLGPGRVSLRFLVREGEKVKITAIRFVGAAAFPEKRLRKQLETKRKGWLGGGDLKPENEERDRTRLEGFYRNRGFRDARVTGYRIDPGADARSLTLVVEVAEGRRHVFGNVRWTGASLLTESDLKSLPQPRPGDRYDLSRIERAQRGAYELYQERAYLYVAVEPDESVRDSVVDLTLRVTEGRPSRVRFVHITGNLATREKVIRRELEIHEGDLFKRSLLVRSQGNIFRLGLFDDVQPDFQPAESTDVDLLFKVRERQVGTASAGAGYTAESGLTGFVQLGHNNVLGNGQSVQITLERGPRRANYVVSFTEPWFRDTPTLVGFELFNSRRERDIFTEKRVGGSLRMGRPLPWPDYTRGFVTYRLEDVEVEQLEELLEAETFALTDSSFLNRKVRTSSLELALLRNSTDNPFYPRRGSRIATNHELAGGVFGGQVDFQKHRLDARLYLPSVHKRIATMLKGRFGVLAGYGGDERLPSYERFRLGGGTVVDPLRGYSDYQIVPPENIRLDSVTVKTYIRDPGGAVVDSTLSFRTTKVRYPGGRFMLAYTLEQQFAIVHPLHGVVFLDAGNVWNDWQDIRPWDLRLGAGLGFRMEIPLLGNIGLDWGYGFDRDDGARWAGHFLLGQQAF